MTTTARFATRIGVLALAAAALVPVETASAASDRFPAAASRPDYAAALALFPDFAALPDAAGLAAPSILHGRLADSAGRAMTGATVLLSARPNIENFSALPDRAIISLIPVARTTVARDGRYELRSPLTAALAPLMGRDGLDLELDVFHAGRQYTRFTQVRTGDGVGWVLPTVTDVVRTGVDANRLDVSFRLAQGAPTAGLAPRHHDPEAARRHGETGPHPFPGAWCVRRKIGEKRVPTLVATTLARRGTTTSVVYGHGAQSRMSTGMSLDAGASFEVNGEQTRTSDFSGGYGPRRGKNGKPVHLDYYINVAHAITAVECLGNHERDIRVRQVFTEPIGPSGGGRAKERRDEAWTCVRGNVERAEFDFVETQNAEAYTFAKGFSFSPVERGTFTGEAVSGYSDSVKVLYTFDDRTRGRWCGHTNYPLAPGQLTQAFQR